VLEPARGECFLAGAVRGGNRQEAVGDAQVKGREMSADEVVREIGRGADQLPVEELHGGKSPRGIRAIKSDEV
jgi:hypothetical protein